LLTDKHTISPQRHFIADSHRFRQTLAQAKLMGAWQSTKSKNSDLMLNVQ
jgi:hypothetical protein